MPDHGSTGAREWNPLWFDPATQDEGQQYVWAVRRIIVASVNWIEAHPGFKPKWGELNKRQLMRAAGVPDDVAEKDAVIAAVWSDIYRPSSDASREWFTAMEQACSGGNLRDTPSAQMMSKGIHSGVLVAQEGWDAFNDFMLSSRGNETEQ